MNDELIFIKKVYGEEMMHLCRELFPSLLEKNGILSKLLCNNLALTHRFARDIIDNSLYTEFKNWIYSFLNVKSKELIIKDKSPEELLRESGYTLYKCETEEEIQAFKKYYRKNEELCTFRGGRLKRCHVFFAVKDGVNEIFRENFKDPQREDEYGVSVLSIQFDKGNNNRVSIKSRYNHTVNSPDCTYNNNLDNIIPGLTKSFEKYYGYKTNIENTDESDFLTRHLKYIKANDGRYYRYNTERDAIYYCDNNILIKDGVVNLDYYSDRARFLVIDDVIIDRKEKKVYGDTAFTKSITDIGPIKNIDVVKDKDDRNIIINYIDGKKVTIKVSKYYEILEYDNKYVQEIVNNGFLFHSSNLRKLNLPNVEAIDDYFMRTNITLEFINIEKVKIIGNYFLMNNKNLKSIYLPNVVYIKDDFLYSNTVLECLYAPNLISTGSNFLPCNNGLRFIDLPNLESTMRYFLGNNIILEYINAPKLSKIGHSFLLSNNAMKSINLPSIVELKNDFMRSNEVLEEINIPNVVVVGNSILRSNKELKILSIPKANIIGAHLLYDNKKLELMEAPKLTYINPKQSYTTKKAIRVFNEEYFIKRNSHRKVFIDKGQQYVKVR